MGFFYRTPQIIVKTVAATGTPERITTTPTPATNCIIVARKAAQTDNATDINIGPVSGDGNQPIPMAPGGQYTLAGVDLSQWYIDVATAGDGVVVIYW